MTTKYRFLLASALSKLRAMRRVEGTTGFYLKYYGLLAARQWFASTFSGRERVPVASYPCSGRTWLDAMLVQALARTLGSEPKSFSTTCEVALKNPQWPMVDLTHAGTSWETHVYTAEDAAKLDPRRWTSGRAIFLWRDPRDVQVSAYHHMTTRSGVSWLQPSSMVDDPVVGIDKVITFLNGWSRYAEENPGKVLDLRYEALRDAPAEGLEGVLCFLGIEVGPATIEQAVYETSFKRMQAKEKQGDVLNPRMMAPSRGSTTSLKTRKGKVGQYQQFFSVEEQRELERRLEEKLEPRLLNQLSG